MRKNTSGFTIVEIIIVVVVIGILASIAFMSYRGTQGRARDDRRKVDIVNLQKALEIYYSDNGTYPIPSGTSSTAGATWYTSGDSSWTTFTSALTGSNAMSVVPVDPTNSAATPLTAGNYGYGYTTGSYCGKTSGQWYLLVYRLETMAKEQSLVGDCSTNPLGDAYYTTNGNSIARLTR